MIKIIQNLPQYDSFLSEDIKITTNQICRNVTSGRRPVCRRSTNIISKEMYQLDANNFTMILFS